MDYEKISTLISYHHETGMLYWLERPETMFSGPGTQARWNNRYAGKSAGNIKKTTLGYEYVTVKILKKDYCAHRVAWLLFYKDQPPGKIDHINMNPLDNRIDNLRDGTHDNNLNMGMTTRNTSGVSGVCWNKSCKKWQANVRKDGHLYYLGVYDEKSDAANAVARKREELGFSKTHGLELPIYHRKPM